MIAIQAITALTLLLAPQQANPAVFGPGVQRAVAQHGSAFVQVAFRTRQPRTLAGMRSIVRTVRTRVLARAGNGFFSTTHWDAVPGMAGWTTAKGLRRLATSPDVSRIYLDFAGHAEDLQADPLVHADEARAAGYTGAGVTVGILDSGMMLNHPDLQDALVAQRCYVHSPGTCPNGLHTQSGAGAGRDDNGHGTNVAGIVTGNGTKAPTGVAPSSKLVIVKVLAADGSFSDTAQVISGLQFILNHPEYRVKVINMSLGTNALFAGPCNNQDPNFTSVVHSLHMQGVTLFASSGNQKSTTKMALPACISEVVAVGAVYDSNYGANTAFCADSTAADKVTCFSNSSTALDLLAPGAATTSTGMGGRTSTYYGTSQASPTAAAAAADLLQKNPSLTPAQIETTLKSTGKSITDARNGRVTPRIDVFAALNATTVGGPPPPPPPPPPPDTQRPAAKARGGILKHGTPGRLRFTVSDDSGSASLVAGLFRKGKRLRQWGQDALDNGAYFVRWTAPSKAQRLSFCVLAQDAAGNQSKQSCADIKVT